MRWGASSRLFRRVELAARRRVDQLAELDAEAARPGLSHAEWDNALTGYFEEYDAIDTGRNARGPGMLLIEKTATTWEVQRILGDPEGHHDWRIAATADLTASDDEGELGLDVTGPVQL